MERISIPIDNEQRKAYYEYFAREVLTSLLPEEFENLQKVDKPDLQDINKSIGIEVTLALLENELHVIDLYDKIVDSKDETEKKRSKEKMRKIGLDLVEYEGNTVGIGHSVINVTSKPLIEAAKRKIDKLNNKGDDEIYEYRDFQHYRLFIKTSIIRDKSDYLNELIDSVFNAQRYHIRKYEVIYVYSDYFGLWACDLVTKQISEYPVTDGQRKRFEKRALELACGGK